MSEASTSELTQSSGPIVVKRIRAVIRQQADWMDEQTVLDATHARLTKERFTIPEATTLNWLLLTTVREDARVQLRRRKVGGKPQWQFRSNPEWFEQFAADALSNMSRIRIADGISREHVNQVRHDVELLLIERSRRSFDGVLPPELPAVSQNFSRLHSVARELGWDPHGEDGSEILARIEASAPLSAENVDRLRITLSAIAERYVGRGGVWESASSLDITHAMHWLERSIERSLHIWMSDNLEDSVLNARGRALGEEWARIAGGLKESTQSAGVQIDYRELARAVGQIATCDQPIRELDREAKSARFVEAGLRLAAAMRKLDALRFQPFVIKPSVPSADESNPKPKGWTQATVDVAVTAFVKSHAAQIRTIATGQECCSKCAKRFATAFFGRNAISRQINCPSAMVSRSRPWRAIASKLGLTDDGALGTELKKVGLDAALDSHAVGRWRDQHDD